MAGSCSWKYIGTLDLTNLLCKMLVKLTLSIPLLWKYTFIKWRVGKDYLLFGRYSLREKDTVVILMHRLRSGLYRIHIRSTIRYIALYLLLFLSIVLKDENHEKYLDIYNSLLFGRGPNRVIEMACFDSKSGSRHAIRSDATTMSAVRCVTTQHLSSLHASDGKKSAVQVTLRETNY